MCAAPAIAGRCTLGPDAAGDQPDAPAPPDAPATDAARPVDAPGAAISLRVRIDDQGVVVVDGAGTCDSAPPQHGDCTFAVTAGTHMLHATPHLDRVFEKWNSLACAGQGPDCAVALIAPITEARAKFRRDD
jgi:hypothetical protein